MRHQALRVNGASLHIAELGEGAPLLLLHGWPEFWLTWEPVMLRLSERYRLIAPDLRGFGDSDKPSGPFGPADHAADMLALLDALGIRGPALSATTSGVRRCNRLRAKRRSASQDCSFSTSFIRELGRGWARRID
jgi:alpha/beta hydrolase fold